jgi:hypothetical protein
MDPIGAWKSMTIPHLLPHSSIYSGTGVNFPENFRRRSHEIGVPVGTDSEKDLSTLAPEVELVNNTGMNE